jgi:transcription initiation factor TFIIH subunit 1
VLSLDLQQTPASNPKVMLRIFAANGDAQEQYVFTFTSATNPRGEADAIKDALSAAIQAAKTAANPAPIPGEGVSAAMAMANAVSSVGMGKPVWDDDNKLKTDAELQQSLLKSDANLQRRFMESLRTKPDTLSVAQFVSQFWSTRVHLLRAHAIERAQTRGSYNVLSTLRPRVEDNVTKLNISKEQIQLIFNQHPLVKRVYDENVPKLSEQQFWSRFFQSRLFKKLRGERLSDSDPTDTLLDKYLQVDEYTGREIEAHVPHFIDLAGNEVNHSQRQGNRPDIDMRPASLDKVPIIRTLNSLSEKIMAGVAPADRDPTAPVGMDEETFNELQLRDLRGDEEQNRIVLNIRDQSRFFAQAKDKDDAEREMFAKQDPAEIIVSLRTDVDQTFPPDGSSHLGRLVEPEEDESDEDDGKPSQQVGSKANLRRASAQIFSAIRERRTQTEATSDSGTWGLSSTLFDRLTLTHATTTEFLHQFWQAFLSGNPDRAGELASLVESLNRAMERVKAVAADAEAERQVEVNRLKQHARDVLAATGKRIRVNLAGVAGGEKVVDQLLGPTVKALDLAISKYKEALAEATAAEATREESLAA